MGIFHQILNFLRTGTDLHSALYKCLTVSYHVPAGRGQWEEGEMNLYIFLNTTLLMR